MAKCSIYQSSYNTSQHDKYLPNTETVSYIVWLDKMNDVQKSRFQNTKKLKLKILKQPLKTDDST